MWQFSEVVDGMSEACTALGLPVIGGNVSFYNESRGADIDPTPVVGVIGLIDELTDVPPPARLAGRRRDRAARCDRCRARRLRLGAPSTGCATAPRRSADLDVAAALHTLVAELVAERVPAGVHDCSDGGLAVALAEMAIHGATGFDVELADARRVLLGVGVTRRAVGRARARRRRGRPAPRPWASRRPCSAPPAAIAWSLDGAVRRRPRRRDPRVPRRDSHDHGCRAGLSAGRRRGPGVGQGSLRLRYWGRCWRRIPPDHRSATPAGSSGSTHPGSPWPTSRTSASSRSSTAARSRRASPSATARPSR